MNGIWCLLFLGRFSMVTGWIELIKSRFSKRAEFVSVDAHRSNDARTYEMLTSGPKDALKSPEPLMTPTPNHSITTHFSPSKGRGTNDYFNRDARYVNSNMEISPPIQTWAPDSLSHGGGFNPRIDPLRSNKF
jgi:hypothetical protein